MENLSLDSSYPSMGLGLLLHSGLDRHDCNLIFVFKRFVNLIFGYSVLGALVPPWLEVLITASLQVSPLGF